MAISDSRFQDTLSNLSAVLSGGELAGDASKAVEQKIAGEYSALVNAGQVVNGMQSLTQNLNHPTDTIALGTGVSKLTQAVGGQETALVTDISSATSDLSTMTGETIETGFRSKHYGGSSTEAMSQMLQTATGKSVDELAGTVSQMHGGQFQGTVRNALTTSLSSLLSGGQANFGNLLATFIPSDIGNVLEDIVDKIDQVGSLASRVQALADGKLPQSDIRIILGMIGDGRFNTAINLIAGVSSKPLSTIETEVNSMSTSIADRVNVIDDGTDMPDFVIGSTRPGFDDESDLNSNFSMVNSFEELEADFRNATRDITEIVMHWSESGTNQYLTAEDLNDIQGGIRYHYVILKDGGIQRGRTINKSGNHIPTASVAQNLAKVQSNPSVGAVRSIRTTTGGGDKASGNHNKYSIGICIIGGIAAPSGSPEFERYLSKKSITTRQWDTIDGLFKTFYRAYPGGQAFGHNDIEENEVDPGFDVPQYVFTRFKKRNIGLAALSTSELNQTRSLASANNTTVQ